MYSTARYFIKTAIAFLACGLLLGLYMLVLRELYNEWPNQYLMTAHTHVVLFGFVIFLILGVALWLFPRAPKTDTRYRPRLVVAAYWILTVCTAGRFGGEVGRAFAAGPALAWIILVCGLGQIAGVALYFATMWSRIRPLGSDKREAAGERF